MLLGDRSAAFYATFSAAPPCWYILDFWMLLGDRSAAFYATFSAAFTNKGGMGRDIRIIREETLYEIVPRARESLPLPPTETTNQLLAGILARTQRDEKVTLCNFVEMNSHSHQHVIPDDPYQHVKFYMEYQKKITDSVRKLTRLERLQLWERRPSTIMLSDLQDGINRLIYLFCNPASAGLVSSIDHYPGLSTWEAFKTCEPSVEAQVRIKAHWTPVSCIAPLPEGNRLSPANDQEMARLMRETGGTVEYDLIVQPLAWLRVYGVTEPKEIEEIRQSIIRQVYAREAELATERLQQGRAILGAERLKHQPYLRPHTPKKKERRISVICADDVARPQIIASNKEIKRQHRKCYEALKEGRPHEWPPGTFIPWVPPKACRPALDLGYCRR
jgi:hypothetical protein